MALRRFRAIAALALLLAAVGTCSLALFPVTLDHAVDSRSASHREGHAYLAKTWLDALPAGMAVVVLGVRTDSNESASASSMALLEDGRRIGPPHSKHADIAALGRGRFSHWPGGLVFSSSDNSDPRTNGRRYTESHPVLPSPWFSLGLLLAAIAAVAPEARAGIAAARRPGAGTRLISPVRPQLSAVLAGAGVVALILHFNPVYELHDVRSESISRWGGHGHAVSLPGPARGGLRALFLAPVESDNNDQPTASRLRVLEDGRPIGRPHSLHEEIAQQGRGRYSHWGETLIFSAEDNSDPAANGRSYAVGYPAAPALWLAVVLLAAGIGGFAWWVGATRIAASMRALGSLLLRVAVGLSLASIALGLAAGILATLRYQASHAFDTASIRHAQGNAYLVEFGPIVGPFTDYLFGLSPDDGSDLQQSSLRLRENEVPVGSPHSQHSEIASLGGGRYSHWDDQFVFSTPDNSSPLDNGRAYSVSYTIDPPPSVVYWPLVFGLGALWLLRRFAPEPAGARARHLLGLAARMRPYLLVAGMALVALFANLVFALTMSAPLAHIDTGTYLSWSPLRTMGYPLFLEAYRLASGSWQFLHFFQLNLVLSSLFLLAYALTRITGSYAIGWLLVAVAITAGSMLASAADILTEAPFAAFAMLHAGFLLLYFHRPRPAFALLGGVFLAAAILVKSVATVLLGPVILLLLFLREQRRQLFLLLLVPAVIGWITPSVVNLARFGFFESSLAGGYALAGHVAWMIRPHAGSAMAEEARLIERRLAPVLAKRPARFASRQEYAKYTAHEYNTLLWSNVVPVMRERYPESCSSVTIRCEALVNAGLMRLSREAIAAEPYRYAYHVFAHDLGLWTHTYAPEGGLANATNARAGFLPAAYDPAANIYLSLLGPFPAFKPANERAAALDQLDASPATRLLELASLRAPAEAVVRWLHANSLWLVALGLAASASVFVIARLSAAAKGCCYLALCLNAYFLGTALAQPYLTRYSWPMQGLMSAFLLLAAYLALSLPLKLVRRK